MLTHEQTTISLASYAHRCLQLEAMLQQQQQVLERLSKERDTIKFSLDELAKPLASIKKKLSKPDGLRSEDFPLFGYELGWLLTSELGRSLPAFEEPAPVPGVDFPVPAPDVAPDAPEAR